MKMCKFRDNGKCSLGLDTKQCRSCSSFQLRPSYQHSSPTYMTASAQTTPTYEKIGNLGTETAIVNKAAVKGGCNCGR